jgi:hypothetical protein
LRAETEGERRYQENRCVRRERWGGCATNPLARLLEEKWNLEGMVVLDMYVHMPSRRVPWKAPVLNRRP